MDKNSRDILLLLPATLAALGAILYGAAFCIAPVWQFGYRTVPYTAPAAPTPEPGPVWPIDINTAGVQQLMELPGIGRAKAEAVLAYRAEHGAFQTVQELERVDGISARMVESWAGLVVAGPASAAQQGGTNIGTE